jgi:hypothetical protein
MRPIENNDLLIRMATALAKMHAVIVRSRLPLLSAQDQDILQKIAKRELKGLELYWKEPKADEEVYAESCKGYLTA